MEEFLVCDSIKQAIVDLIAEQLEKSGCKVVNCKVDTDVDIAKVAVRKSRETSTTLIREDTDRTKFCNSFQFNRKHEG